MPFLILPPFKTPRKLFRLNHDSPPVAFFLSAFSSAANEWAWAVALAVALAIDSVVARADPTSPNYAPHPEKRVASIVSLQGLFVVWVSSSVSPS